MRAERVFSSIERGPRKTLVCQLAESLKDSIVRGVFKPGEALPSIAELARKSGTSEKVPRVALRQLAAEGWVSPRRGVGSVVLAREYSNSRGRVLLIIEMGDSVSIYPATFMHALLEALRRGGYDLFVASAGTRAMRCDFERVEKALSKKWDLVIECGFDIRTRALVEKSGCRFLSVGSGRRIAESTAPGAIGVIQVLSGKALPEFVRACARKGVRDVWQLVNGQPGAFDATELLKVAEIEVGTTHVHEGGRKVAAQLALDATLARLASNARTDLILVSDDYLLQGVLTGLLLAGKRIPEDVALVSLLNRNFNIAYVKPISALVMDAAANARVVARAAIDYLKTGRLPACEPLGTTWRVGSTI